MEKLTGPSQQTVTLENTEKNQDIKSNKVETPTEAKTSSVAGATLSSSSSPILPDDGKKAAKDYIKPMGWQLENRKITVIFSSSLSDEELVKVANSARDKMRENVKLDDFESIISNSKARAVDEASREVFAREGLNHVHFLVNIARTIS